MTVAAAMTVALLPVLQAATAPAAVAAGSGSITLHVESARTVNPAAGFVHVHDAVTSYKWMINADDTGNPGCRATLLPKGPTSACRAAPDYNADLCQWPSTRPTDGVAEIVAQGDQTDLEGLQGARRHPRRQVPDLGHRRRLQDRRRALHRRWRTARR